MHIHQIHQLAYSTRTHNTASGKYMMGVNRYGIVPEKHRHRMSHFSAGSPNTHALQMTHLCTVNFPDNPSRKPCREWSTEQLKNRRKPLIHMYNTKRIYYSKLQWNRTWLLLLSQAGTFLRWLVESLSSQRQPISSDRHSRIMSSLKIRPISQHWLVEWQTCAWNGTHGVAHRIALSIYRDMFYDPHAHSFMDFCVYTTASRWESIHECEHSSVHRDVSFRWIVGNFACVCVCKTARGACLSAHEQHVSAFDITLISARVNGVDALRKQRACACTRWQIKSHHLCVRVFVNMYDILHANAYRTCSSRVRVSCAHMYDLMLA